MRSHHAGRKAFSTIIGEEEVALVLLVPVTKVPLNPSIKNSFFFVISATDAPPLLDTSNETQITIVSCQRKITKWPYKTRSGMSQKKDKQWAV